MGQKLSATRRLSRLGSVPGLAAVAFSSLLLSQLIFGEARQDPIRTPSIVVTAAEIDSAIQYVSKAQCAPGDRPEPGLQGQVPIVERQTGAAANGYYCNLYEKGSWGSTAGDPSQEYLSAWANFDTYKHCAYFHDGNDGRNGEGRTVVLDLRDSNSPTKVAELITPAMTGPWESLRVNAKRGLLVAGHLSSSSASDEPGTSPLDVYDVSKDCKAPRLLASVTLPTGVGHEGFFQPDGNVYYVTSGSGTITPIDLSDPSKPKELATWSLPVHGGSVSADGRTGYFCMDTEVAIVDVSEVAALESNANYRIISRVSVPGTSACQATYPIQYKKRKYLLQFGEFGDAIVGCPDEGFSNFSRPNLFSINDPKRPRLVSVWMNEVADPENCPAVAGDRSSSRNRNGALVYGLFVYGTHMCHPDRLRNPTLMACAEFLSGVRVYDIRRPRRVKEVAYYNAGSLSVADATVDMAASRPVFHARRGEIWYVGAYEGFHALRLSASLYSKRRVLRCALPGDWFAKHYARVSRCD